MMEIKKIGFTFSIELRTKFVWSHGLQEKGQDNLRKRAATWKELSTLKKDKEDESKYYLNYTKASILEMKVVILMFCSGQTL